ncbi:hypothetical protein Bca101_059923 [Brassica carinata]
MSKLILGNQKSARIHLSTLHRSVCQSSSLEQSAANTEESQSHEEYHSKEKHMEFDLLRAKEEKLRL